jgi:hypothetical protein
MKLRDGTTPLDPRLDRLEEFDHRSLYYPVRTQFPIIVKSGGVTSYPSPKSKTWWAPIHLDQGPDGACVGFACCHDLSARPHMIFKGRRFAREELYWAAQKIDKFPGGAYPGAEPRAEGSSILAGAKVLKSLGYISAYRWAFDIEDLVGAISWVGPAIVGIPWYSGMFEPKKGVIEPTGHLAGKHAILVKGVDLRRKQFKLHNSFGVGWGRLGDCRISFPHLAELLEQNGEACIPITRNRGIL